MVRFGVLNQFSVFSSFRSLAPFKGRIKSTVGHIANLGTCAFHTSNLSLKYLSSTCEAFDIFGIVRTLILSSVYPSVC